MIARVVRFVLRSSLAFWLGAAIALSIDAGIAQEKPAQSAPADKPAEARLLDQGQRQQVIIALQQIQIFEERERSVRLEKEKAGVQLQMLALSFCGSDELNVQTMACEAPKAKAGKDGGH